MKGEFIICKLAKQNFAIDVKIVRDVAQFAEIYPIALTPVEVLGTMNIRGSIIVILSLAKILKLTKKRSRQLGRILVIEYRSELIGLLVDEVGEIINQEIEDGDTILAKLSPAWREFSFALLTKNYQNSDELLPVLDLDRAISHLF